MLLMRGKTRAWQDTLRSAPHQLQIASESQITIAPFLTLTGIIATFALHIGLTLYSFFLSLSHSVLSLRLAPISLGFRSLGRFSSPHSFLPFPLFFLLSLFSKCISLDFCSALIHNAPLCPNPPNRDLILLARTEVRFALV